MLMHPHLMSGVNIIYNEGKFSVAAKQKTKINFLRDNGGEEMSDS